MFTSYCWSYIFSCLWHKTCWAHHFAPSVSPLHHDLFVLDQAENDLNELRALMHSPNAIVVSSLCSKLNWAERQPASMHSWRFQKGLYYKASLCWEKLKVWNVLDKTLEIAESEMKCRAGLRNKYQICKFIFNRNIIIWLTFFFWLVVFVWATKY